MEGEPSKRPSHTKSSAHHRRPPSPSPSPPPNPAHGGVVCLGPIQEAKLEAFLQHNHTIQKFAHVPSLRELHIYKQVHTSYKVPTTEFLSSVYLDHGVLNFRLIHHDYAISLDQINAIVGALTENTSGPNDPIEDYSDLFWWTHLTHLHPYVSSADKASSLIHPMMKVAHRIITSLVIPREERSTISVLELKILYAMANSEKQIVPHYGQFLCNKLLRLSTSRSGKIYCGGIVSMLAKSAPVRAPYPADHQPLQGEPYLTTVVLESTRLFHSAADGTHHWIMGQNHDPKLLITP
ncbi:unnamed protein product [Lactuca saligna]|uniref:Arabidopsis retrotransposon Orf1 C-terminal domain-containing protein n=1 Tax=Lactuca saligna TaxID=75948 RepID=A0AA35Z254_LACSI|nr:unnamed protein product [Lactuca saligna]